MKTLVLSSNDLESLLDLDELRRHVADALKSVSSELLLNEPRNVVDLHKGNALGFMPAQSGAPQLLGYKSVAVFTKNAQHGLNPHQGLMTLLCPKTGRVMALLEGSRLTALRTAAASAVATERLARDDAKTLSVLGAGVQAFEHIRALNSVRNFQRVKLFGRDRSKAEILVDVLSSIFDIQYCDTAEDALKDADVVVTCTSSNEPIIDSLKFPLGSHVNAVGSCRPGQQEIDFRMNSNLRIFLDHRPSCLNEADEVFRPRSCELVSSRVIGELGEVLNNKKAGRESQNDITVFKSVGIAAEDLFAANFFYQAAIRKSKGTFVQF